MDVVSELEMIEMIVRLHCKLPCHQHHYYAHHLRCSRSSQLKYSLFIYFIAMKHEHPSILRCCEFKSHLDLALFLFYLGYNISLVISYNNPFWRSFQIFCVLGCLFLLLLLLLLLFLFAFSAVIECLFNWQITKRLILTASTDPLVLKTKQFQRARSISVILHKVTMATFRVCDWLLMAAGALSHLWTPLSS